MNKGHESNTWERKTVKGGWGHKAQTSQAEQVRPVCLTKKEADFGQRWQAHLPGRGHIRGQLKYVNQTSANNFTAQPLMSVQSMVEGSAELKPERTQSYFKLLLFYV